jgi:glycosyltransferase involved in cell wall biosynthesis
LKNSGKDDGIRVAIEARVLDPAQTGGVAQVVMGLASSLSALDDGDEEYVFVGYENAAEWLGSHLCGRSRLHIVGPPPAAGRWKYRIAESAFGPALRGAAELYRRVRPSLPVMPRSDGTAERLGADLIHFPIQNAYLTDLPSIYQPYDLQHVHLPQLFHPRDRQWREIAYPLFCARATLVPVEDSCTRLDIIGRFNLPAEKVIVVPIPAPTATYRQPTAIELQQTRRRLRFDEFIFYPAQTWPHKNHVRLIEALALLRDKHSIVVPLVCSGRLNAFFSHIEAKVRALEMAGQVQFLGYVGEPEIRALYGLCAAVVVPTTFEAASLPVWEAFDAGKAVACSNIRGLPGQVAGAALLFDPNDVNAMAAAIKRLWEDRSLREDLGDRGRRRASQFTWRQTARHFRAAYRRVLGRGLTAEDREILAAAPLI